MTATTKTETKQGAAHTPGPWAAVSADHGGIAITAEHAGMTSLTPLARLMDFDESAWPDARLIAAAPDLLEIATESVRILRLRSGHLSISETKLLALSEGVLAKAGGRS